MPGHASFERSPRPLIEPPQGSASWIQGARGVRLHFSAREPADEPWGVVYFVLGPEIGGMEPYPKFTEALLKSGIATVFLHARGAGFSGGARGDIDDYSLFLDDFRVGLEQVRAILPGKTAFLFSHSAGAALALPLAAKAGAPPAGIILVNPAYKMT